MLAVTKENADNMYLSPLNIIRGTRLSLSYRIVNHVLAYIYVDISTLPRLVRFEIGKYLENKYSKPTNFYYHCLWDTDRVGYSIGYRSNPRNVTPLMNSIGRSLRDWDPILSNDIQYLSVKYHILEVWLGLLPLVDIIFSYGWGLSAKSL